MVDWDQKNQDVQAEFRMAAENLTNAWVAHQAGDGCAM